MEKREIESKDAISLFLCGIYIVQIFYGKIKND